MNAPLELTPNPVQHARDLIRVGKSFSYACQHAFDVDRFACYPRPLTDLELSWIKAVESDLPAGREAERS